MSAPRSLFDKLWDTHVVVPESEDAPAILFIDLHLVHEVTSPQAFAVLEEDGKIPADKLRDRAYEQLNTFSNVVSLRWPSLNLLLLNFAYHNAHHEKPVAPWYRLPKLHEELYGDAYRQVVPMSELLSSFHRHRVRRVLSDDYGEFVDGPKRAENFYGAVGVSFLTAV